MPLAPCHGRACSWNSGAFVQASTRDIRHQENEIEVHDYPVGSSCSLPVRHTAGRHTEIGRPGAAVAAELHAVTRLFGSLAVLREVSVQFQAGSATVLLGPNGAGKSTLLRLLAGLLEPSRGSVSIFGADPREGRRRIGYMSHSTMLYDELSAMENLRYFARLHKGEGCDCAASPEMALRAVGLDPKLSRPVGQYSQGMRQRTALARVLQGDPELLLLDEPFANLDVGSVSAMVELLADFRTWPTLAAQGRTIVLTTHQAHLAEPLADRTLYLEHGRLTSAA